MDMIVLFLMMAVTVEGLIEYGKTVGKAMLDKQYKTAITHGPAWTRSVLLCFAVGADFYAVLNVQFTLPWVGCLLTGIFASRGANFVSDLFKKLQTLGDNFQ